MFNTNYIYFNTNKDVLTLCCCSRRSCSSIPCASPCNTNTLHIWPTPALKHWKWSRKFIIIFNEFGLSCPHLHLLLQHHGSSMLSHLQLIILCHAWRGQPWGLHAHVDARRRGASRQHSNCWYHAHTRRHGWHGHLRHGGHHWHLDRRCNGVKRTGIWASLFVTSPNFLFMKHIYYICQLQVIRFYVKSSIPSFNSLMVISVNICIKPSSSNIN